MVSGGRRGRGKGMEKAGRGGQGSWHFSKPLF